MESMLELGIKIVGAIVVAGFAVGLLRMFWQEGQHGA